MSDDAGGLSLGFLQFMEAAPDAMLCVDNRGRIVLVNEQAVNLFGHGRNDLLGHPISKVIPERYHDAHKGHVKGYVEDPHVRPMGSGRELFAIRADGTEFPVEISLSPVTASEGTIVAAAIRDVSERKAKERLEREAESQKNELEHLKELDEFRKRFINAAAHELYTPLTPIQATLQLLQNPKTPEEKKPRAMRILNRSFSRLSDLVADLLEVSRYQSGKLTIVKTRMNVAGAVANVVDSFAATAAERKIDLSAEIPDELKAIADERRINQVLYNLVSNAFKFTQDGGSIRVSAKQDGDQCLVSVADDGAGMDPEQLADLFQPFMRMHQDLAPGTGLGLYISRGLVEAHGGELTAWSGGPKKGTTFTASFPIGGADSK